MNPERVYRQYRDEALATQLSAPEYMTFVAMPFRDVFSYRSRNVFEDIVCAAADCANKRNETPRKFGKPCRVDDDPGTAAVITEEIVVQILSSHIVVADLTLANHGVLLELGIALGLKPNKQIVILLQGDPRDLHFDIRNNRVISYDSGGAVDQVAAALIAAARAFEADSHLYVKAVRQTLSLEAIQCLKWYGTIWRNDPDRRPSLHPGNVGPYFVDCSEGAILFAQAIQELFSKRLMWTEYVPKAMPNADYGGIHATDLGWAVIEALWDDLKRHPNAPTPR